MAPSREYKEGLPYSLVVNSITSIQDIYTDVRVKLFDGYFGDAPKLFRIELRTFFMGAAQDSLEPTTSLYIKSSFRVLNSFNSDENLRDVIGHIVSKSNSTINHIYQDTPGASFIVERPQNGNYVDFKILDADTAEEWGPSNIWTATFNLYPILESDTLH